MIGAKVAEAFETNNGSFDAIGHDDAYSGHPAGAAAACLPEMAKPDLASRAATRSDEPIAARSMVVQQKTGRPVTDVISAAAPMLTSRYGWLSYLPANEPNGGRMPKVKGQSALDKERAKTEKLLKKVGYTALKEAGVKSKGPDLPNLKTDKRGG